MWTMRGSGEAEARAGVPWELVSRLYLLAGLALCVVIALVDDPLKGWMLAGLVPLNVVAGAIALRRDPDRDNPAWYLTAGSALLVPAYVLWYPARLAWDLELGSPRRRRGAPAHP